MSPLGPPSGGAQPPAPPPGPGPMPERMKANKTLAGKVCPGCGQAIALGADVFNCPACGTPQHAACRDGAGACRSQSCAARAEAALPPGAETKFCPYCGETVLKSAKKCKHCKEILSVSMRLAREKRHGDPNLGRDALLWGIASLICCPPICGPVAIIKGKEARGKEGQEGLGTAGMVLGIIGCALFVVSIIARIALLSVK